MSRRTDPPAATVKLVRERDDWRCARCAGWGPLSTQHRVPRGMGGTTSPLINLPSNLLTLCGDGVTMCHGLVERKREWAKSHGWSAAWWENPTQVPVWTWRGWVYLTDDGRAVPADGHQGVAGCDCGCRPIDTPADLWTLESI